MRADESMKSPFDIFRHSSSISLSRSFASSNQRDRGIATFAPVFICSTKRSSSFIASHCIALISLTRWPVITPRSMLSPTHGRILFADSLMERYSLNVSLWRLSCIRGLRVASTGLLSITPSAIASCSGQLKLATALEFFQYRFSDLFGDNPPLYSCGLSEL